VIERLAEKEIEIGQIENSVWAILGGKIEKVSANLEVGGAAVKEGTVLRGSAGETRAENKYQVGMMV